MLESFSQRQTQRGRLAQRLDAKFLTRDSFSSISSKPMCTLDIREFRETKKVTFEKRGNRGNHHGKHITVSDMGNKTWGETLGNRLLMDYFLETGDAVDT